MIGVFFVPGTFGSTVDAALNFNESMVPCANGSSHVRFKALHSIDDILSELADLSNSVCISPFWPWTNMQLDQILATVTNIIPLQCIVIIYCNSFDAAELNLLFQLHKMPNNDEIPQNRGLYCICGDNLENIRMWNSNYTHWTDMQQWELREWLHFFYPTFINEWKQPAIELKNATFDALFVPNVDILNNPHCTITTIANYCNVELHPGVNSYLTAWQLANRYIVVEYQLTKDIIHAVRTNTDLTWSKLNIIQEAIVQYRLTEIGYKLRCRELELNDFPQTTASLLAACEKM
jgi:hypothetical protein